MARHNPHIPFERYADDIVCHCRTEAQARTLWRALGDRFAACRLELHPQKTKIVYCKDVTRPGNFPIIAFDFLGFQFRARKTMWGKGGKRVFTHSFQPAASPKALKAIGRTVRAWTLQRRSDKSLQDLAEMCNPHIRGWITYYSHFYKTQLRPTLIRIDAYVIKWARRKFKRMRHQSRGVRAWLQRVRRDKPQLLVLQETFGLDDFERDVLLLAFAPAIDGSFKCPDSFLRLTDQDKQFTQVKRSQWLVW